VGLHSNPDAPQLQANYFCSNLSRNLENPRRFARIVSNNEWGIPRREVPMPARDKNIARNQSPKPSTAAGGAPTPLPVLLKIETDRRWAVSVSVALQSFVLLLLMVTPLVSPERISLILEPQPSIILPPRKGAPDGHRGETVPPKDGNRPPMNEGKRLTFPTHIPDQIVTDFEAGLPSIDGEIGVGRAGNGFGDARGDSFWPWDTPPVLEPPLPPTGPPPPVRVGGRVRPPRQLVRVEPDYPRFAKHAGVEGKVVLQVRIGTTGRIEQVDVLEGHPALVLAARSAVEQWEYEPTYLNDEPVPVLMIVTVEFRLRH
jgi:protein TonB